MDPIESEWHDKRDKEKNQHDVEIDDNGWSIVDRKKIVRSFPLILNDIDIIPAGQFESFKWLH